MVGGYFFYDFLAEIFQNLKGVTKMKQQLIPLYNFNELSPRAQYTAERLIYKKSRQKTDEIIRQKTQELMNYCEKLGFSNPDFVHDTAEFPYFKFYFNKLDMKQFLDLENEEEASKLTDRIMRKKIHYDMVEFYRLKNSIITFNDFDLIIITESKIQDYHLEALKHIEELRKELSKKYYEIREMKPEKTNPQDHEWYFKNGTPFETEKFL